MNDSTKVALAVVGGYVLGRRKKVKLALLLGSVLVGKRLDVRSLGKEVVGRLAESPEVGRIVSDVRGELVATGRAAAISVLSRPLESLADRLEERTAGLTGARPKGESKEEPEETDEGEEEGGPKAERREEEPEEEEEEAPRRRRATERDRGDGSERRRSRNAEPPPRRRDRGSRAPTDTDRRGGSGG